MRNNFIMFLTTRIHFQLYPFFKNIKREAFRNSSSWLQFVSECASALSENTVTSDNILRHHHLLLNFKADVFKSMGKKSASINHLQSVFAELDKSPFIDSVHLLLLILYIKETCPQFSKNWNPLSQLPDLLSQLPDLLSQLPDLL